MKYESGKCRKGCGPVFCCCMMTHYGLGFIECRCRCHDKKTRSREAKTKIVKIRTDISY